jgi:glycosyltransferase involved in cell wall biosynthesis
LKILSVFNHYVEPGGEAIAVEAICSALAKEHEVEKCEFRSADWMGPDAPPKWKQALWMMRNPQSAQRLRETQARFGADIWLIHNIFPVVSGAVYSEAHRLGVPLIQYVHNFRPFSVNGYLWAGDRLAPGGLSKNYWQEISAGAWQHSRAKTAWLAAILLWGHTVGWWRGVRTWIAISEFMRQKFISCGVPADNIFTLRHYWNPQQTTSSDNGNHFLFLGRLTEAKGINVLLDAWEILERRGGPSVPKLMIGGDGPLREMVVARAERSESVTYAGPLSGAAKEEAFRNARAVIVPSISWEALGLVVYEAYDYGKPVLAAASGGISEIVVSGETGLIHAPGNCEELANQVIEVESDDRLRQEMGRRGRAWLETNANEARWRQGFTAIAEHAAKNRCS